MEDMKKLFRYMRLLPKPPFRRTFKGCLADVSKEVITSSTGHLKKTFQIVDAAGYYITCCALGHTADSKALENNETVVIYYATERQSIGKDPGMLYVLKGAMILPVNEKTTSATISKC